jgi:methyltransferase (TIGR00027 family)
MTNPISRTAYYTLGVRAWDASQPNPVCGDSFAKDFMNEEAQSVWREFKDQLMPNVSNASRHAIIDTYLRQALSIASDSQVVIIGAGFDTRAFRIKGGSWIEVDESAIITYKESILAASKAQNTLNRISIHFETESLLDRLTPFSKPGTVHIIIEGVFMYLTQEKRKRLIEDLQSLFPKHIIYCDLMRQSFFKKYGGPVHEKIKALGASFTDMLEHPENLFLDNGYKMLSCVSIPLYAARNAKIGIPSFIIRYFLKTLRDGYQICRFETVSSQQRE